MTRSEFLDQQEITIVCEGCRRKTVRSYHWLKTNSQFTCTCGDEINLKSDRYRKLVAGIEAEAAKLAEG